MSSMTRRQLTDALNTQLRYASANSVIFSKVVADRVGQHSTDLECLDFLLLNGPATAGQLADLTGLTTGAVTAVIDRLENAGYVRRERDKDDRRKVMVVPEENKIMTEIAPFSMSMGIGLETVANQYSEEELAIIVHFLEQANAIALGEIAKLRSK
ncbi:MAG: MarR family transcriptional regulator [Herpetosiphonaceae bacterium]|nr:MarR family transcriptional regulator [Herpetosiphonaceae bacterium]